MPEFIDDGSPDGATFGREGGKIGLYGGSPVARPTITAATTSVVSLAYLRARISRLEQALLSLGIVAFDGLSGPIVPDPDEPFPPESYAVIYGGLPAYYGEDEAIYQDEDVLPPGEEAGSLYGEYVLQYGEKLALYE